MAFDGWELVLIDSVISKYNPGCLAGLSGGSDETIQHKFLIFRMKLE